MHRWARLGEWLLAIPHVRILIALDLAGVDSVILDWCAILIAGRHSRSLFSVVEGVLRWSNRVAVHEVILVTDANPPTSLAK